MEGARLFFKKAVATMKKSLFLILILILLAVFFFAGARFSQRGILSNAHNTASHQILHYVDPMNPAHTSKEPGIAPCGMPMEPVYADQNIPAGVGSAGATLFNSPGTVRIPPQKQQIIGVQVGEVAKTVETAAIRALGRIIPEENRIYNLVAATEGWLEDINEATTGSLVRENQLLAQIKVYNYDFFTWQQRYLTERGYTNRLTTGPSDDLATANQSRRRMTSGAGYEAGLPIPESEARLIKRSANIAQMSRAAEQRMAQQQPSANDTTSGIVTGPDHNSGDIHHQAGMTSTSSQAQSTTPEIDHSTHQETSSKEGGRGTQVANRDNSLLYSSKGRLELLNFGVDESQIEALTDNGVYITHVNIRSPVNGYVLARNISPRQKIDRGSECFRLADLGQVWVEATIHDIEAHLIHPGMEAKVYLPKQKAFATAYVSEYPPRFDPVSRSLKVRLTLDNPELIFRPDMFVDVEFLVTVPESIAVPVGAVIDSGKRKTVYVVKEEGVFEPREVTTGWQLNDRVEIVTGLQPGEQIVVAGNFLIDSESRMKLAALRLMEDKAERPSHEQPTPAVTPPSPATPTSPAPQVAKQPMAPVEKSKDPVCGMMVRRERAIADGLTFDVDGKTYYFCSADCKEQFRQDPQRFLSKPAGEQASPPASGHGGHPHD